MHSKNHGPTIKRVDAPISNAAADNGHCGLRHSRSLTAKKKEDRAVSKPTIISNDNAQINDSTPISDNKAMALAIGVGVVLVSLISVTIVALKRV